jgi:hypothetical protein
MSLHKVFTGLLLKYSGTGKKGGMHGQKKREIGQL